MIKRILCVLLSLSLLCVAAGCRSNINGNSSGSLSNYEPETNKAQMQLLCCYSDTFNPYTAVTTLNREVCGLLYDSLMHLNNEFEVVYELASEISASQTECIVTLREAVFSDGSPVTAEDVVYSFNAAKTSNSEYAHNLYEFSHAAAADSKRVVFSLVKVDEYAANLLDFPIIKSGSDKQTDADGVRYEPCGSGRYILTENKDMLVRNEEYYGKKGSIKKIKLINAPDAESVSHYVEIGATDVYFADVADGNIVRMSGKKTDINMNNLVFIGINDVSSVLQNVYMRYALSSALSRKDICKNAYHNNAVAANGIFHPDFAPTKQLQNIKNDADSKIAIENLEKIGYNRLDSSGYRINSSGKRPVFSLLVNSDNASRTLAAEFIASQLKNVGIEIRVVKKSYEGYIAALQSGNFQLYLGEIRLTDNMDLSSLLLPGGSAAYGRVDTTKETDQVEKSEKEEPAPISLSSYSEIVSGFYEGKYSIADVSSVLLTQLPIIPVCYRNGLLFYDSSILNLSAASHNELYYSDELGRSPNN